MREWEKRGRAQSSTTRSPHRRRRHRPRTTSNISNTALSSRGRAVSSSSSRRTRWPHSRQPPWSPGPIRDISSSRYEGVGEERKSAELDHPQSPSAAQTPSPYHLQHQQHRSVVPGPGSQQQQQSAHQVAAQQAAAVVARANQRHQQQQVQQQQQQQTANRYQRHQLYAAQHAQAERSRQAQVQWFASRQRVPGFSMGGAGADGPPPQGGVPPGARHDLAAATNSLPPAYFMASTGGQTPMFAAAATAAAEWAAAATYATAPYHQPATRLAPYPSFLMAAATAHHPHHAAVHHPTTMAAAAAAQNAAAAAAVAAASMPHYHRNLFHLATTAAANGGAQTAQPSAAPALLTAAGAVPYELAGMLVHASPVFLGSLAAAAATGVHDAATGLIFPAPSAEPQPIGATSEQIEAYTQTMRYKGAPDGEEDEGERCTVCLDDFVTTDRVRTLRCTHLFHVDCIDRWLMYNKKCPVCRLDMDTSKKTTAFRTSAPGTSANVVRSAL